MAELITLARPYAKAAFAQAQDKGVLAEWSASLALAAAIAEDESVAKHVLGDPLVTAEDQAKFFIESGAKRFSGKFPDFIRLLAENNRLKLLAQIAILYERYRAAAESTLAVEVRASKALSKVQQSRLSATLKQRFKRDISLEVSVDESLLGGAVIYAGDTVIDGSLKSRLARLNAALAQ